MINATSRWWRRPDHFYWLTAYLAARGAQSLTCRMISLTIVVLTAMPVALLWSPAGPQSTLQVSVTVCVGVFGLFTALFWLRKRWPTRRQSQILVIAASIGISASCALVTDPLAGLLGAAAFAVLGGYIAFFHSPRLTAYNLVVALSTAAVLAVRLAETSDLLSAICRVALVTLTFLAVPLACQAVLRLVGIDTLSADIDPLTGLLNAHAFSESASELLAARCREDDRHFAVVVLTLDSFRLLADTAGEVAAERALVAIGQSLRENTRRTAVVGRVEGDEFVIADTFSTSDPSPLVERVRGAIAGTPPRLTASIGAVTTPMRGLASCPPQDVLDELTKIATSTMADARRAGGNQARRVVCAAPAALLGLDPADFPGGDDSII